MDYNHIKNYLDKVKEILFSKEEAHRIISNVIEKNVSIKIDSKLIQIKGTDIFIKTTPIVRNEILIKKRQILSDLSFLLPKNIFKDIK